MAVSNVELVVNAVKAINPLRKVKQQSEQVSQALEKNKKAVKRVEAAFQLMGRNAISALRDVEGNAQKLGKSMGGLRANVAKAVIAFGAFKSTQVAIQRIESERRIKFLAQSYGEVAQLQDAATKAAKRFGTGQTEANRALADVFARLRPVGVGLEDIVSVYNGFNTAAKISGSTAVEASNAFRQLSQALGSGALRGDEFNSISEQVPGILTAISAETGVAQGQLRKFAAEGGITADVVIRALKRIETEGAAQLEAALGGPAQAIVDFQNATEDVQVALTEAAIPELSKSFVILAEIIKDLKPVIQAVGSFAAKVLGGIANTIKRIRDPNKLAAEQQAFFAEGEMRGRMRRGQRGLASLPANYKEQEAALFAAAAPSASTLPTPPTLPRTPKPTKIRDAAREKAQAEQQRLLFLKQINAEINRINQAELDGIEAGRKIVEQIDARGAAEIKTGETNLALLQAKIDGRLEEEQLAQKIKAIEESNLNDVQKEKQIAIVNQTAALEKQIKAAEKLDQVYESIGSAVSNGIVNALTAAVEGTKSLADVASQTLRQVANILLQFGVNTALGGIPGLGKFFGGGRASGGTVTGGRSYMVGEKGPELFTPGRTGSIAPSGSFGGANVVVNVDASGSQAQGNQPNAKALGSAIGAAVQAELIKQKRPGGLLA